MVPSANQRDNVRQSKSLKFKPAKRRRPPSNIRRKEKGKWSFQSIWTFDFRPQVTDDATTAIVPVVFPLTQGARGLSSDTSSPHYKKVAQNRMPKKGNPWPPFLEAMEDPELPFLLLYRWWQSRLLASFNFIGPLHPFFNCSLMFSAMYLSSVKASATPQTPKHLGKWKTIDWLYRMLFFVETLGSHTRKMRIWTHLDKWLKWWNLIPRHVPSIGIPGQLFKFCKRPVRRVLSSLAGRIDHPMARRWFYTHWRVHRGKVLRWCDEETGTKTLADACFSDRHWDENTCRYLAKLPSLKEMGT